MKSARSWNIVHIGKSSRSGGEGARLTIDTPPGAEFSRYNCYVSVRRNMSRAAPAQRLLDNLQLYRTDAVEPIAVAAAPTGLSL